jgi:hypothetical protein
VSKRVQAVSESDVERIVHRDFAPETNDHVLRQLESYGTEKWHRERHRVRLALLKLANGDLQELECRLRVALVDFRDVLAAAEYPGQFRIGFIGMEKLGREGLEELERQDWEQFQAWFHRT